MRQIYSKQYNGSEKKITRYCTVVCEGGFEWPPTNWRAVLQLIHVHADNEDRIRFGYYRDAEHFVARPLEMEEEHVPALIEGACQGGVLRQQTIREIKRIVDQYC